MILISRSSVLWATMLGYWHYPLPVSLLVPLPSIPSPHSTSLFQLVVFYAEWSWYPGHLSCGQLCWGYWHYPLPVSLLVPLPSIPSPPLYLFISACFLCWMILISRSSVLWATMLGLLTVPPSQSLPLSPCPQSLPCLLYLFISACCFLCWIILISRSSVLWATEVGLLTLPPPIIKWVISPFSFTFPDNFRLPGREPLILL